jgi:hypothetical protein
MKHLTIRVAWHDSAWNGAVCKAPNANFHCYALDRIRIERDDAWEHENRGKLWKDLDVGSRPPCEKENGFFMADTPWRRMFVHPYMKIKECAATHGVLKPTIKELPARSALPVPYGWMLREHTELIQEKVPVQLPPDQEAPFKTAWVYSRQLQESLLELFFNEIREEQSLCFFYTKEGHPLPNEVPRLVVGVGGVTRCHGLMRYDTTARRTYPLWERIVEHSIDGENTFGVLLPYHDYLAPTGDRDEDSRRLQLLNEIAVQPPETAIREFSFGSEHAGFDTALVILTRTLEAVRRIREQGIAKGNWAQAEDWINLQIGRVWRQRGAFPGAGAVLEAAGLRLGTYLHLSLLAQAIITETDDPWPTLDAIIRGNRAAPQPAFDADLRAFRNTWGAARMDLLKLLSRMDLSVDQARRWYDPGKRIGATVWAPSDTRIVENPFTIVENDLGGEDPAITMGQVDRALLPDDAIAVMHPVPEPSRLQGRADPRRIRAALVTVLRRAETEGDSLLSVREATSRLGALDLSSPIQIPPDWFDGDDVRHLDDVIEISSIESDKAPVDALQLRRLGDMERSLALIIRSRARVEPMNRLSVNWSALLRAYLQKSEKIEVPESGRYRDAFEEQVHALSVITSRRLTVLAGAAGTGKTTLLGALVNSDLKKDGILLLAPTGKASVRLSKKTGADARTIASFLLSHNRYDTDRQIPIEHAPQGSQKFQSAKTVIVDECSMLTLVDLRVLLDTLDLGSVTRVILVGDPNQLPPIGVGRPFADICGFLATNEEEKLREAIATLTVEVRRPTRSDPMH